MSDKPYFPPPAYVWFDTEFTSLAPGQGRLLQVALIVTDTALRRIGPAEADIALPIRHDPRAPVSAWVRDNLADLLRICRSDRAVAVAEADRRLAAAVDRAVGPPAADIAQRPVLAGNAVHADLRMIEAFLPRFAGRLHYRLLDVSTLKIVWKAAHPERGFDKDDPASIAPHLPAGFGLPAGAPHDAYYDVHASLAECAFYLRELGLAERIGG